GLPCIKFSSSRDPAPIDAAPRGWRAASMPPAPTHGAPSSGTKILPKPLPRPVHHIPPVLRIDKPMTFIGINNQLRGYMLVPQRMPELERLRRRALPVPVPHQHQRRRLRPLDVVDCRALRIDRRIVVHRRPKVGNHPLVNGVLPVVALPV